MNQMYQVAGISKQGLWNYNRRQEALRELSARMVEVMKKIRNSHRRIGCRRMYYAVEDALPVGRDRFEQIGFANGFKLKLKRNKMKTTWAQRVEVHPNLLASKTLNGINQAWQSDIFYLQVENEDFFGVTIIDVYSRKMLALHLSQSLSALQNERALKKALRTRAGYDLSSCIFHSDRGSQYISHVHKALLTENRMRISMCKVPQENAYVERVQGTLKHEYFYEFHLTRKNLQQQAQRILRFYNGVRPHSSLNMMTPDKFETYVEKLPEHQRPFMKIHEGYSAFQQN